MVLVAYVAVRLLHSPGGVGVDMAPALIMLAGVPAVLLTLREAIERSDDRFELGFEQSTTGMSIIDLQGRFVRVNRAFAHMLGHEPHELTGRAAVELTHPADRRASRIARDAALAGDDPGATIEHRYLHSAGPPVWVRSVNSLLADRGGRPALLVNQVEDVTERRRNDERLRRLAALVDSSEDAVVARDAHGVITYWNAAAERLYGYSYEEAVGSEVGIVLLPGQEATERKQRAAVLAGERVPAQDTTRRTKDGRTVEVSVVYSPIPGAEGTPARSPRSRATSASAAAHRRSRPRWRGSDSSRWRASVSTA